MPDAYAPLRDLAKKNIPLEEWPKEEIVKFLKLCEKEIKEWERVKAELLQHL